MSLLSDLLDFTFFSGVPSNATYDLIKAAWKKATDRSWEALYLDAFQAALHEAKPYLEKYVREGGDIALDREALFKVLHQDLAVAPETWSYSQLSEDKFIDKLASAMEARSVLIIGGNELSQVDYSQLVRNLLRHAKSSFKETILSNEQAFRRELIAETLTNQEMLQQVQNYLVDQFGIQVLGRLDTIEGKIDSVATDVHDIKQLVISSRYFMTLNEFLTRPGPQFPKMHDFEQDLVFLPEKYISEFQRLLGGMHRVLLVGRTAAGKTVFGIALAKQLQERESYDVFYLDTSQAQEGDGRAWYQVMHANDCKNVLYILDNCHLAPREVNDFCFQWEGKPLRHVQTVLISRPRIGVSEVESLEIGDYFDMWGDVNLEIRPEEIYRGVIKKYVTAYNKEKPNHYITLEDDSSLVLEKQHAHNLVFSRNRLEVWRKIGGQLSKIEIGAVYDELLKKYEKYLFPEARETLLGLCALWQYEIPAHNLFVESRLSKSQVKRLKEERLLTSSVMQGYGELYQLIFHPEEAREILEANIYRQFGSVDDNLIDAQIVASLKAYLITKPLNYVSVYQGLVRHKQKDLLQRLLTDRELQDCVVSLFEMGKIFDIALYLSLLSTGSSSQAQELLLKFVQTMGIRELWSKLLELRFQDIYISLKNIAKVDVEIVQDIVAEMDIEQLVQQAERDSLQGILPLAHLLADISPTRAKMLLESDSILSLASYSVRINTHSLMNILLALHERKYLAVQVKAFVEAIDIKLLAQKVEGNRPQRIFWLFRNMAIISPAQAKALVETISLQTLLTKTYAGDLDSLSSFLSHLHQLGYPSTQLQAAVEALDINKLAYLAETKSLQTLFWLIRILNKISSQAGHRLLETITPAGLVSAFRSKKATFETLRMFSRVSTNDFWQQVISQLSHQDLIDMFNSSSLHHIANYFRYNYFSHKQAYVVFQQQFLMEKLATESFFEIGRFIRVIRDVPREGLNLAYEVLDSLITIDLSERIADTGLRQIAYFFNTVKAVDKGYPVHYLIPNGRPEILFEAFERSNVDEIQFFIYTASDMDQRYLLDIQQCLQASDLTERLALASLKDIGQFLWNVFAYIDQGLAREYCKLVDVQQRSSQLRSTSLDELCRFLWNLAQISDLPKLQTFEDPIIKERLIAAWKSEIGQGAELFGIVDIACPKGTKDILLPPIESQVQKEHLAQWFANIIEEQKPFVLALTLYGLRTSNEREAQAVVQKEVSISEALELLQAGKALDVTPLTAALLEETLEWLEKLPRPRLAQ